MPSTPKNNGWPIKLGQAPLFSPSAPTNEPSKSFDKQVGFFWQPRSLGSRYRQEFEQLEPLGRGGGGQVVKARNRLDGHLYAVKKIRLPDDRASEVKILREVTIWSRMNHPKYVVKSGLAVNNRLTIVLCSIVRYHTAWTEYEDLPQTYSADQDTSTQLTETLSSRVAVESTDDNEDDSSASDTSDPASDFDEDDEAHSGRPGDDLDIDLGLDDLDDMDFLSVGHSKSVSYPSIHFGNEDDPSTNGDNSPAVLSKRATRTSSPVVAPSPKHTRTLYIQVRPPLA